MKLPEVVLVAVLFGSVALILGYLTDSPEYQVLPEGQTELKFVVRHSGKRLGVCKVPEAADMAKLAPNMRQLEVCPSEKSPMAVELRLNGQLRYSGQVAPSGIHNDGVIALYRRFSIDAGSLDLHLRLKSDIRQEAFSHDFRQTISTGQDSIVVLHVDDSGVRVYQPGLTPVS
ncbi:MAG: hypothetical protein O2868_05455 [Proteobacteria bacterium]|jgi:hypothetical protein|nr:hypothetical protein [Pseudomonadota bacterium]